MHEALDHALAETLAAAHPAAFAEQAALLDGRLEPAAVLRAFALAPRRFPGRSPAPVPPALDPHGVLARWPDAARARLQLLRGAEARLEAAAFDALLDTLFASADVAETVFLAQALPFLREPLRQLDHARACARSNMPPVFSAVAHDNDLPRRAFDQNAWNQLVLKAAFLGEPIWNIPGLAERNNPELVQMLRRYVDERRAAGRDLPWDLWACIGWLAGPEERAFLSEQFEQERGRAAAAIALALLENAAEASRVLGRRFMTRDDVAALVPLSWPRLAEAAEALPAAAGAS
ncbi:MAG: hypothetical protein KatS3mg121_1200 [Gammaproteobacteria bacterium]|nr:MAG: hypothetical protein KatS3mg121_1200 [Gammaproteobacteria bacterium]